MGRYELNVACLCAIVAMSVSGVDARAGAASSDRPKTALVLSGGGARGWAHVGAIRKLEELRVPVDVVVGASAGAIVGALYASGYSPDEMETLLDTIDWSQVLSDTPDRDRISFRRKEDDDLALLPFELGVGRDGVSTPAGLASGSRIDRDLSWALLHAGHVRDFDDLSLPFRAVATDLDTGEMVVLGRGDLVRAIRASLSIPGVLTPVEIDGRLLVDAAIARNLPIDVARTLGAERVIAVDVGTTPAGGEKSAGGFGIGVYAQTFSLLSYENVRKQLESLGPSDVVITPALGDASPLAFDAWRSVVPLGYLAAEQKQDALARFAVTEAAYERYRASLRAEIVPWDERAVEVTSVAVSTTAEGKGGLERGMRPDDLARRIDLDPPESVGISSLDRELDRVAQAGEFEQVVFRAIPSEPGGRRLAVQLRQKRWGPGYLRNGVGLESDLEGETAFRGIVHYRRPQLNRLGDEWKVIGVFGDTNSIFTDFFQPLGPRGFWFVGPSVTYSREKQTTFIESGDREVVRFRRGLAVLDTGFQFRNFGELRFGIVRGFVESDIETASASDGGERDVGGIRVRAVIDQLDNVFFPTRGNRSLLEAFAARRFWGDDDEYEKVRLRVVQPFTFGRNTIVAGVDLGTDLGSDIPFDDRFELGGFLNLSGYPRGRFRGDVQALFSVLDYVKLTEVPTVGRLYLGGALQAGNVWADVDAAELSDLLYSGTVFVGLDTPFLPIYAGYGRSDDGVDSFYVFIGAPF